MYAVRHEVQDFLGRRLSPRKEELKVKDFRTIRRSPRKRKLSDDSIEERIDPEQNNKSVTSDYSEIDKSDVRQGDKIPSSATGGQMTALEMPDFSPYVRTCLRDGEDSELVVNLVRNKFNIIFRWHNYV